MARSPGTHSGCLNPVWQRGQKFPHVYKLIGKSGFCVPILGLVDEAEKNVWHGQIGGKPADVFGTILWVSTPDLEAEYCRALTGPGAARALINGGFREAAVLSTCQVQTLDAVTVEPIAEYCRRNKVEAAVAIASELDLSAAEKIASVYGLLDALRAVSNR